MYKISYLVYQFFNLVLLIMLIAALLSWFPNLNRQKEPVKSIIQFSELFFAPFRKFIPPVGMIDISAMFAFIAIALLRQLICSLLVQLGL